MNASVAPKLERFADGQLSPEELATTALNELLRRRRDVHTVLLVPNGQQPQKATDVLSKGHNA